MAGLVTMLAVTACGGGVTEPPSSTGSTTAPPVAPPTTAAPSEGFGSPVRLPGELDSAWNAPLTGELTFTTIGCWAAVINDTEYLVALPVGFTMTEVPGQSMIVGPDGVEIEAGSHFDGVGRISYPPDLDARWAEYVASCEPTSQELIVFDKIEPAFDPTALTDEELVALVQIANLEQNWPCGIGFAISTADQRVGIVISATGPIGEGSAELPDSRWQAEVRVGRHLFANNCDDVFEPWETTAEVIASWPLAGTLRVLDPLPTGCGAVSAQLRGGSFETDSGPVSIGDLDLFNEEFGCFAG